MEWLDVIWRQFPADTVQNSFMKRRFTINLDIDIDVVMDFI